MGYEEWRDVIGYEGFYQVSNFGRVRSIDRCVSHNQSGGTRKIEGKLLKPRPDGGGYYRIGLTRSGKTQDVKIHALVAQMFIGERPKGLEINHKDGCRTNNQAINLEYCTRQENALHAHRTGLTNPSKGESNGRSKLKETDIPLIREKLRKGETQDSIAKLFNVGRTAIRQIKDGTSWKTF